MKRWKEAYGDPAGPTSDSSPPQVMAPFGGTRLGRGLTVGVDPDEEYIAHPQRGGYSRGRGGRGGRGAHSGYHPYQRPAYHANRSVVFNNSSTSNGPSGASQATTPTKRRTPEKDRQHQAEPKLLCPAFTSTGTQKDDCSGSIPCYLYLTLV